MREKPYAGPSDTDKFDGLSPNEMAKAMHEYQLLGQCFETLTDEQMMGRGWLMGNPLILVEGHADNLRRAQRELAAAVGLARNQGNSWTSIADALSMPRAEVRTRYEDQA